MKYKPKLKNLDDSKYNPKSHKYYEDGTNTYPITVITKMTPEDTISQIYSFLENPL